MKRIIDALHIICIALIPGYWLGALFVYIHHKIKHQPVKLREEEKKIAQKVHKKLHAREK